MKLKSFGRVLKKVVAFIVIVQMLFPSAFASGNILSLYKNKEQDNTPFAVGNILPGDYIKQDYCIRVSYNGTVTVKFTADVRQNFEKLAEVLKCKVVMPEKNTILYDGLIRDIPDLPYTITGVNTTEDIKYEIAVYLDAVVGNEYQNLRLIADFRWWAETSGGGGGSGSGGGVDPDGPDSPPIDPDGPDSPPIDPDGPDSSGDYPDKPAVNPDGTPKGELIDPPYTGDYINPVLLIAIICISLFLIFLILFIRKKNISGILCR